MKSLVLALYFLSFSTGVSAFAFSIVIYLKYRNHSLLYYIYFLIAFTIKLGTLSLIFYFKETSSLIFFLGIIEQIASISMVFLLPLFFYRFLQLKWTHKRKKKYLILLLINFIIFLFFLSSQILFKSHPFLLYSRLINAIFIIYIIFIIEIIIKRNRKNIANVNLKKVLNIFLYGLPAIMFTIFLLNIFYPVIFTMNLTISYIRILFPLIYMGWNILYYIFVVKFFLFRKYDDNRDRIENALSMLNLTNRERQLCFLLLGGNTAKDIATRLFISEETVKKHISNIYSKLGINKKVQLINLIHERINIL